MELRHGRELAQTDRDFPNGHLEDSMTVASQFEKGIGPDSAARCRRYETRIDPMHDV
jgi:hypothetical protein